VNTYLELYEKLEDRLYHFPKLVAAYFYNESINADGFLKQYLEFERELRLVLVGFRAKKLGRNVMKELQFENPEDPIVHQILAQKDEPLYEPPEKYTELKSVFDQYQDEPLALYLAVLKYRVEAIDQMLGFDEFSINRILGYFVQMIFIELWQKLDKQKGKQILDTIVKEAI
jgi:hypothetical protein